MERKRNNTNPILGEVPFVQIVRRREPINKINYQKSKKKYFKNGIAPWKVVVVLIIGLYIIVLPYFTTTSFKTTTGEIITACVAIIYSAIISCWYVKMIPARIAFCQKRKLIKQANKQRAKAAGKLKNTETQKNKVITKKLPIKGNKISIKS